MQGSGDARRFTAGRSRLPPQARPCLTDKADNPQSIGRVQPNGCDIVPKMPVSLLVLGGTEFVGRAVVNEGRSREWEVTTFNRGRGVTIDGACAPGTTSPRIGGITTDTMTAWR